MHKGTDISNEHSFINDTNNRIWNDLGNDLENELIDTDAALNMAKKIGYQEGVAFACLNKGYCLLLSDNHQKALPEFQKSVTIYKDIKDTKGEMRCLIALGNFYEKVNILEQAIDYNMEAIKLAESIDDKITLAAGYGNLGEVFYKFKNYKEALNHYLEAHKYYGGNNFDYPTNLCNIAKAYIGLHEYEKPLEYLKEGLLLAKKNDQKLNYTYTLSIMGVVYQNQKKYELAADTFFRQKRML